MREWNLKHNELPRVILAADSRLSNPNYHDDQIWELVLREGEPTALSLNTTYGLRARGMRVFFMFTEGDEKKNDPETFAAPPVIHRFYPNYTLTTFSPFPGIDVVAEYWVVNSFMVGGRIRVINSGVTPRKIGVSLIALLRPAESGQTMAPGKIDSANILQGRVQDLVPVIFMSGGPEASHSPYPSLFVKVDLLPGLEKRFLWAHAAKKELEDSFQIGRSIGTKNWDAELTRIEMMNTSHIEIQSGERLWDAAFFLGQNTAYSLIPGCTDQLPESSFVQSRRPDLGFSLLGDGSDYDHLWSGQSSLDTWQIFNQVLPASPQLAEGFLKNYLANQRDDGHIDWKPGLNGSKSSLLATPLLATLAWRLYEVTENRVFLNEVFSPLKAFNDIWFNTEHDRDENGIPEWDHPMQTGFEDNPLFARWQTWSQGLDISLLESPALMAFLFNECQALVNMARILNDPSHLPVLRQRMKNLQDALDISWDSSSAAFHYLDRESYKSPQGKKMGRRKGSGSIKLSRFKFGAPTRLIVRLTLPSGSSRSVNARIIGFNTEGDKIEEELTPQSFRWEMNTAKGISQKLFASFEIIDIFDLEPDAQVEVNSVNYDFHDQTLLLPLWARMPSEEKAKRLIDRQIANPKRYWRKFGLLASPTCPQPEAADSCESVWSSWNTLIGEGLLSYGYRQLAADLVIRLMDGITKNLKKEGGFRQLHHAVTGDGLGERDTLSGLPPLRLFLETLGVTLISPWKVHFQGINPFPWSVKIKFRGLTITRGLENTTVVFPSGKVVEIKDPTPCTVSISGHK